MADQERVLTAEELQQVCGGFDAVEHGQITPLQTASQQMSFMMSAVDSVIKGT